MEERVPPAGDDPSHDIPWPRRASLIRNNSHLEALVPPADHQLETYVVQYPKDQIYRVPPPEHAILVERYRNPIKNERKPYCRLILRIVIGLALLGAIIGITLVSLYLAFDPKPPDFSITHVVVKSPPSSNHHKSHPGYEITLEAINQNEKIGIAYSSDGDASMLYKEQKIGTGKFPELYQESNNSTNVLVVLDGTNETLPLDIEKSIEEPKSHFQVSLALKLNVGVYFNVGPLSLWSRNMDVGCNFKVSTMGTDTKVLSQQCNTTLN